MWILALIGTGVLTALIHLAVLGWNIGTAGICEVFLLHQFAVTSGLIGVLGFYINVIKADETAKKLNWPGGPFQGKYGFSQLGVGVMGVLTIFIHGSFWIGALVTLYIYGISGLWSHVAQMKRTKVNAIDIWNLILDVIYHAVLTILLLQIPSVWN